MDTKNTNKPVPRRFAGKNKPQKPDGFTQLLSLGGFLITMGLLLTATGVVCYIPFHNRFSKVVIILGLGMAILGFALKVLDIFIKIVKDNR